MKLLNNILQFFKKNPSRQKIYLSLVAEQDHVAGACWFIHAASKPKLIHAVLRRVANDDWDERIVAADQVISALEAKIGEGIIEEVIFGLPNIYLNEDGDIKPSVKPFLKKLTDQLSLKPIGFVSLCDAIIYKLKFDDGVPPSVILISLAQENLTVTIYKIGKQVGIRSIPYETNIVDQIEQTFKNFKDLEVLPSRIYLFGIDRDRLRSLQGAMTKHPWPTKANFIHFPQIELLSADTVVRSVSVAGSGELKKSQTHQKYQIKSGISDPGLPSTNQPQTESDNDQDVDSQKSSAEILDKETDTAGNISVDEYQDDSTIEDEITREKTDLTETKSEKDQDESEIAFNKSPDMSKNIPDELMETEESNVSFVSAEKLGFKNNEDILSENQELKKGKTAISEPDETLNPKPELKKEIKATTKKFPAIPDLFSLFFEKVTALGKIFKGKTLLIVALGLIIIFSAIMYWVFIYLLPKSEIKITVLPETITQESTVIVDTQTANLNPDKLVIPGLKQEHSVTTDETIAVSGKKNIGDPAKGIVTIYNKTLSSKTFKKGTTLINGNLEFKLDDEIKVASATESIGSVTYGKSNAAITASQIGTKSNLPAGSEFTFDDLSDSIAIARNDQALTGGTSKEVTVVTRADYDALINKASSKLKEQVKKELVQKLGSSYGLIEDSLETEVTKKTFAQELDQEVKQLQGQITVTISGVAYDQNQIKKVLQESLLSKVTQGYILEEDKIQINKADAKVSKDGTISLTVDVSAVAIPFYDVEKIKQEITGKSLSETQDYLKNLKGISELDFEFSMPYWKNRMPKQSNNIKLDILVKQ